MEESSDVAQFRLRAGKTILGCPKNLSNSNELKLDSDARRRGSEDYSINTHIE
jgi:hypothetical protein